VRILTIVASSLVVARVLKAFILVGLLKTTVPVLPLGDTAAYALRVLIAGAGSAAAAIGTQRLYEGPLHSIVRKIPSARVEHAVEAIVIGAAGAAVYLALSLLLKMEEPRQGWHWFREKLRRRGQKLPAPAAGADAI
jgi:hypothetical protein